MTDITDTVKIKGPRGVWMGSGQINENEDTVKSVESKDRAKRWMTLKADCSGKESQEEPTVQRRGNLRSETNLSWC